MFQLYLLSFFMFCISTDTFATEQNPQVIQQKHTLHATQWVEHTVSVLEPQDIHIAANILYLLYANALIDIKIRQFVIPITKLNQSICSNIAAYKDTTEEITTLKTLLDRLSYIMGARTIYNRKLTTCVNFCNNLSSPLLPSLIAELQIYGQKHLNTVAESEITSLEWYSLLQSSGQAFTETAQQLQDLAQIYASMKDGSLLEFLKKDQASADLAALIAVDKMLQNNFIATQSINHVLNTLDYSSDVVLQLVLSAHDIYRCHYEMLHNYISSDNFDKTYAQTLFSMHDVLPHEYQTLLPHPDNIFEHILQTTKLYTHIELVE